MLPKKEIDLIAHHLKQGHTILYPTETVWGLGCSALDADAIQKVSDLKRRPSEKSYVLLVDSLDRLQEYVKYVPKKATGLILYHEKPLTIIYNDPLNLPDAAISADNTVAIRVTKDPFCKALVEAFGGPIVSTSANISGEPYPTCFDEISKELKMSVDYASTYKRDEISSLKPSTIVSLDEKENLVFIRRGD